jgi:hypothetical protein
MSLLKSFWQDEAGFVLSAELALIGTIGVVGATVGLSVSANAINEEMQDLAFAFRSLDQSYHFQGYASKRASVAGSRYAQPDISRSLEDLRLHRIEAEEKAEVIRQEWTHRFDVGAPAETKADDHET